MAKKAKSRWARQLALEPEPSPWITFFNPQPSPWRVFAPEPATWIVFDPQPSPWITQLGPGAVRELRRIQTQHVEDVQALQSNTLDRAAKVIKKAGR
jgi:hypothetical protein